MKAMRRRSPLANDLNELWSAGPGAQDALLQHGIIKSKLAVDLSAGPFGIQVPIHIERGS